MKNRMVRRTVGMLAALVLMAGGHDEAASADGVTEDEIVLGQSCALSGPNAALGMTMKSGLEACFAQVNATGGLDGRSIRLISLDDGYEPVQAIQNSRELLDKEDIFLLIGLVGTPTVKAVLPVAEEAGVPLLAPLSGAEYLRNPPNRLVVNLRAGTTQETAALAEYLVERRSLTRIACFVQNDSFGQDGMDGMRRALERYDLDLVATGTYERNTMAVKGGLLKIHEARPEAVVMVGTYGPCAEFIKLGRSLGMAETLFCTLSAVGPVPFLAVAGEAAEGCIISQVMPMPTADHPPLIGQYRRAMETYAPEALVGFVSLEGYLAGRLFVELAKAMKMEKRQGILDAVAKMRYLQIGGLTLSFGPLDNQGFDGVFLSVVRDGAIIPLDP